MLVNEAKGYKNVDHTANLFSDKMRIQNVLIYLDEVFLSKD